MASPALRLLERALPPLPKAVESGRLLELSADTEGLAAARTTTAVSLLRDAQRRGETAAWVQPAGGSLFPPDLDQNGIDLEALVVVHIPPAPAPAARTTRRSSTRSHVAPHRLTKATEILLRSGAFGIVVVDLCDEAPAPGTEAWQGRLLGLARQNHSLVVLLTEKPSHADSLGALVSLRIEPRRRRAPEGGFPEGGFPKGFIVQYEVLKNKSGAPMSIAPDAPRGPWGLK